ncbi:MAG: PTS sugar transporter subunit IIA [Spirochaetaceae bacterium]|jgi:PTS system nitrogen regulatory IIA component|nr:PTS sugar transporter subunit IIA [Spirochaetaceae bacterium]
MVEEEILTIEEVARYLRVSERTVYDWAQKGEIPAGKIGTVWRFKKNEIERWVNDRLAARSLEPQFSAIQAETIIAPDRVMFLQFPSRRDALLALADNLATAPQVKNRQELAQEILKREDLMSTAVGRGIAIPHVRLASVTDLVVSVGVSRVDITGFQALDDEPVRILLMIAAAYNQHAYYLQALSFFSARLKNRGLREELLTAEDTRAVYELLTNTRRAPAVT